MKNTPAILLALSIFILFFLIQQVPDFSLDDVFSGAKDAVVADWSGQKIRIIPELLAYDEEEEYYEEEYYEEEYYEKGYYDEEYEEWIVSQESWEKGEEIYDAFMGEDVKPRGYEEEKEEAEVECSKDEDCGGGKVCMEDRCVSPAGYFPEVEQKESELGRLLKSFGVDLSKIPGTKGKSAAELTKMPAVQKALTDKKVPPQVLQDIVSTLEKQRLGKTTGAKIEITNPLKHQTFEELIRAIIVFLRNLALVATALVIVLSGFYFVTAAGDPAKVTKARQMILYALIGLAIVLAAEGIVTLMEKVIKGT